MDYLTTKQSDFKEPKNITETFQSNQNISEISTEIA
jgi:hypothetical protein